MRKDTIFEGNLTIRTAEDAKKYSHLCEVTGYLHIYSNAELDALKSIGGYLYIRSSAKLDAPKLESIGGYSKFKVHDGIGCVVLSSKQKAGVTILSCRRAKIKNQKVIGDKFYIAQKDGHNAHGETIKEAIEELAFKTGDRDVSEYRSMPLNTRKTPAERAFIYRVVAGACQYGVTSFIESKGELKKHYTLKQIIAETQGAYGHATFVAVTRGSGATN